MVRSTHKGNKQWEKFLKEINIGSSIMVKGDIQQTPDDGYFITACLGTHNGFRSVLLFKLTRSIKVVVDGKILKFDVEPVIKKGRTLVPVRAIGEALGASVSWDNKTNTAVIIADGKTVQLKPNSLTAYINSKKTTLEVPLQLEKGRIMVPVRFISETFNAKVDWDANTKTINISRG